jgi:hypothetical protein
MEVRANTLKLAFKIARQLIIEVSRVHTQVEEVQD